MLVLELRLSLNADYFREEARKGTPRDELKKELRLHILDEIQEYSKGNLLNLMLLPDLGNQEMTLVAPKG